MAMSAEMKWKSSLVAPSAPFHTGTESSMMLAAAKPDTASERTSSLEFGIAAARFLGGEGLRGIAQVFQRLHHGQEAAAVTIKRDGDALHGEVGAHIGDAFKLADLVSIEVMQLPQWMAGADSR
jgi:hypothetical protein